MIVLLFGKPLVFWLGIIVLVFFVLQIYLGVAMVRGNIKLLKYHKLNALVLSLLVIFHLILALFLYGVL